MDTPTQDLVTRLRAIARDYRNDTVNMGDEPTPEITWGELDEIGATAQEAADALVALPLDEARKEGPDPIVAVVRGLVAWWLEAGADFYGPDGVQGYDAGLAGLVERAHKAMEQADEPMPQTTPRPAAPPVPDEHEAAAREIMTLLTPLVADAAIVGRSYGWPDVLAVVRAVAVKLRPPVPGPAD